MNIDVLNSTNVTERLSNEVEDSFVSTYSSLQLILSQVQMKLAAIFLQESEYLRKREEELERNEELFHERCKSLKTIENEREEFEQHFVQLQHRLEAAIVHVIRFQTDGVRDFSQSIFFDFIENFRLKFFDYYLLNLVKSMTTSRV